MKRRKSREVFFLFFVLVKEGCLLECVFHGGCVVGGFEHSSGAGLGVIWFTIRR